MAKASQPPKQKKADDQSDELSKLFDDGTTLKSTTPPLVDSPPLTTSAPLSTRPVAPERDFNRRANSLERVALPSGLFPGSSKKLYDALYLRTRGAVVPTRTVEATKRDLAEWSGVRNRKTIDAHMRHLETVGLITRAWQLGSTGGYVYEVHLPEEAALVGTGGQRGDRPADHSDQISDGGTYRISASDGQSQTLDYQRTAGGLKTSLRQDQSDDEPAAALAVALAETEREVTGRNSSNPEQWRELASVLSAELRIAAARTTVSNVPAFLAEHLRRRLWKIDKKQAIAEGRDLPDNNPLAAQNAPANCPKCAGTGWHYPGGQDAGVARCKHDG